MVFQDKNFQNFFYKVKIGQNFQISLVFKVKIWVFQVKILVFYSKNWSQFWFFRTKCFKFFVTTSKLVKTLKSVWILMCSGQNLSFLKVKIWGFRLKIALKKRIPYQVLSRMKSRLVMTRTWKALRRVRWSL